MRICSECFKEILSDDHNCLGEPERYYEWMLWRLRKEKENEARANNSGTSRNRQDDNSAKNSRTKPEERSSS